MKRKVLICDFNHAITFVPISIWGHERILRLAFTSLFTIRDVESQLLKQTFCWFRVTRYWKASNGLLWLQNAPTMKWKCKAAIFNWILVLLSSRCKITFRESIVVIIKMPFNALHLERYFKFPAFFSAWFYLHFRLRATDFFLRPATPTKTEMK